MRAHFVLSTSLLILASGLAAQRAKPTLEFNKRTSSIDHGAVKLGKHTLEELPIGGAWRLGNNEATFWKTTMPMVGGEQIVPPGEFRLTLHRTSSTEVSLTVHGGAWGLGNAEPDLVLRTKLETVAKPTDKLVIEWVVENKSTGATQDAKLRAQYGAHAFALPLTAISVKPMPKPPTGWNLAVAAYPAALLLPRIEGDQRTPIISLAKKAKGEGAKEPDGWNLVVGKSKAWLVPIMEGSKDSFGFGDVPRPVPGWQAEGEVEWLDAAGQEHAGLELASVKRSAKGEWDLRLLAGAKEAKVTWREPRGS